MRRLCILIYNDAWLQSAGTVGWLGHLWIIEIPMATRVERRGCVECRAMRLAIHEL